MVLVDKNILQEKGRGGKENVRFFSTFHTLTKERLLGTQVSQSDSQIHIPAQTSIAWDKPLASCSLSFPAGYWGKELLSTLVGHYGVNEITQGHKGGIR